MKKVIIAVIVICAAGIALFLWYMSSGIDRDEVYYNTLVTYKDVVYKIAEEKELTLDILMPARFEHDEIPVVFYVHGGTFSGGDKINLTNGVRRSVVTEILDEGYAIISINYRYLDEDSHFPSNIRDVKDAIRYITSVAEDYNFDVNNYGLWGTGTGAYLALTAAYSPSGLFYGDYDLREYDCEVNYVIDMAGVTNISTVRNITEMDTVELAEAQAELDTLYGLGMDIYNLTAADYEEMALYDPLSYISNDTVPTYIMHGLNDDVVNINQSIILKQRLAEFDIIHTYYEVLGGDNDFNDLADTEVDKISSQIVYFIKTYYKE
ncbi:MAG: alpha/beta hydrolase [Tenericutes bacterium]|nr:alpha/beta hydrolase [Mycoplasmatota bacterium]